MVKIKPKEIKLPNERQTPPELIQAIQLKFGFEFYFDLAASNHNSICGPNFFGPGSSFGEDSLTADWSQIPVIYPCFCNPPYSPDILPWAKKIFESNMDIYFLTPTGVSSKWFREYVFGRAEVRFLTPRPSFTGDGKTAQQDITLSIFGKKPDVMIWDWVNDKEYTLWSH